MKTNFQLKIFRPNTFWPSDVKLRQKLVVLSQCIDVAIKYAKKEYPMTKF